MRALFVVLCLAACGGGNTQPDAMVDVPADAMPRQVVSEAVPLVINEIVEAKLVGGPTDYARVRMTASGAPIDWNLHGHMNNMTQIVEEGLKVPSVDYLFVPPAQGDWYLLIRNKGTTDISVQLDVELYNEVTWSGWI